MADIHSVLAALDRIERGEGTAEDFNVVGDCWDIRLRFRTLLAQNGLDAIDVDTPAVRLSGGECTRVVLIGAQALAADLLILDEPTNHLDRRNRQALLDQLES